MGICIDEFEDDIEMQTIKIKIFEIIMGYCRTFSCPNKLNHGYNIIMVYGYYLLDTFLDTFAKRYYDLLVYERGLSKPILL